MFEHFQGIGFYFLTLCVVVLAYRLYVLEWWVLQLRRRMGIKR